MKYMYYINKCYSLFLGTAHVADIYPASDQDPLELIKARETITQTLAKWLAV